MATQTPKTRASRVPDEVQDEVAEKAASEKEGAVDLVAEAKKTFEGDVLQGIHGKMAHIMATMRDQQPTGKNQHFKYTFWSMDQIASYFRRRFGELNVSFGADVLSFDIREHATSKEGRSYLTTLLVRFTLTDVDTGEQFSGTAIGQGDDPGDKGSNKALSGATKYWLLKVFLMGGEDAEADERTDERADPKTQNVKVEDSKIEGIRRGGRSSKATDVQIRQIATLAGDMEWTASQTATAIGTMIGDEIELPEDPEEQGPALRKFLAGLSSEDAGKIVTRMTDARDEADAPPADDRDDDGSVGY